MKETLERELKLGAEPEFRLPDLGGELLAPRSFVSTYHDTADHRLARGGITLRHRVENGKGAWQLKLPRRAARLELEVAGGPAAPPDELAALLVAVLRGRPLVPLARLRTRRESVRVGGAEVVHDSVAVLENQRVERSFDELEIELLEGDELVLRRLEKALRKAGAGARETRPKLLRALDLAFDEHEEGPQCDGSPAAVVRMQVRAQLGRMLRHDPGVRAGGDDEDIHQLRVATRRLRAFLRAAGNLVDEAWATGVRARLARFAEALGAVRDLDVLLERVRDDLGTFEAEDRRAGAALVRVLERERRRARAELLRELDGTAYLELLERIESGPPSRTDDAVEPSLRGVWTREWKRLVRHVRALGADPSDEDLHEARIRVKRARYAAELAASELGRRGAAFVDAAKALQDVLGAHQDAAVAEERLRALSGPEPQTSLVVGRLVERARERRAAARVAWPAAWARLEKRAGRIR